MLGLKFNITKPSDCTYFTVVQTTGIYNVSTNLTGWGTPNDELSGVQDSYVTVKNVTAPTTYQKVEITASASSSTNIIYKDLIKSGETVAIGGSEILDGIYSFEHFVLLTNNSVYNETVYSMSLCQIECKIKQLTSKYIASILDNCKCEEKLLNTFVEVMSLYDVLKLAFQCGKFDEFKRILTNLQSLLAIVDCEKC